MTTATINSAIAGASMELHQSWPEIRLKGRRGQEAKAWDIAAAWVPDAPREALEIAMSDPQIVQVRCPAIEPSEQDAPLDHIRANILALVFQALFFELRRLNASREQEK